MNPSPDAFTEVRRAMLDVIEKFTVESGERATAYEANDDKTTREARALYAELQSRRLILEDLEQSYGRFRRAAEGAFALAISEGIDKWRMAKS